jgi:hypothetical protein
VTPGPAAVGTARFQRVPAVVHRAIDGGVLLVDAGGESRRLVGSAGLVWIALDEPGTVADLLARLRDVWPDAGALTVAALADAVAFLAGESLLEVVEPAAGRRPEPGEPGAPVAPNRGMAP